MKRIEGIVYPEVIGKHKKDARLLEIFGGGGDARAEELVTAGLETWNKHAAKGEFSIGEVVEEVMELAKDQPEVFFLMLVVGQFAREFIHRQSQAEVMDGLKKMINNAGEGGKLNPVDEEEIVRKPLPMINARTKGIH